MSTERNKAAKRQYIEAFNRRDLTAFEDLFAAEYILHATGFPDVRGPGELRNAVASALDGLSDAHLIADDMVAEGDKVATRWTIRARHTGVFMGVAPTEKALSFSGTIVDRFVDGKVVEAWETIDMFGLMQQLGALQVSPATEAASTGDHREPSAMPARSGRPIGSSR